MTEVTGLAGDEAQNIATQVGRTMLANDRATQMLGIMLDEIRPGYARMHMVVREEMLNGHDLCHGGFIFTLADSTFAFACNSRNFNTVAAAAMIDFLAPGRCGDRLTAEAIEQSLAGRTGVYDIVVSRQDGTRIALFRGKSHRISGEVLNRPNVLSPQS